MPRGVGLDRDKVIAAAAALVDAEGADALTLSHLADQLGIRPPSLFRHVDGLADLVSALMLRGYEALDAALADAGDDLEGLAQRWRAWALAHPGLYTLVSRAEAHSDEQRAAAAATTGRILAAVAVRTGDGTPAVHATRALRALVHGFVMLELHRGFAMDVPIDESFEHAVRALVAGW